MNTSQPTRARRARALTIVLTSALCGGVGAGTYGLASPDNSTPLSASPVNTPQQVTKVTFTDADTGSCVNWQPAADGSNKNFTTINCAQPHRFEVSVREDLSQYPTSEFGPKAPRPQLQRQEQLTEELCVGPTLTYLDGRLDPEGRYSISPILPPASSWAEGDRTMLCGVMVQDSDGRSIETVGLAAQTDQSRTFPTQACVRVVNDAPLQVPCDEDHTWQVTDRINLRDKFPAEWPSVEAQNDFLNERCTQAARAFLGNDDALYYSTLTPFWTTIQSQSWAAGSRNVNCAVTFGRAGGGFAVLKGDARRGFTIDGQPPQKLPPRNPLRPGGAPGSTGASSPSPAPNGGGTPPAA